MGSEQVGYYYCFAQGFAYGDYEQTTAKKRTRRERFLSEMEKVVPWKALFELIEPHCPKTSSKGGRPPYPLATMRRFAWIDMISDRIPDETTILTFRHLLEKHDLGQQIFEVEKAHLKANGMGMKQGTIIDATLIAALASTLPRPQAERAGATKTGAR
jgi:IS5 family transposase